MKRTPGSESRLRRRRRFARVAFAIVALFALSRLAAADESQPKTEISLGFGGAHALESSIFNLASDERSTPDLLGDFRVRQNLNQNFALGFHLYGTVEQTPKYYVTYAGASRVTHYDLSVFHVGVDVRYLLARPPFQPFLEAGVSFVSGTVEDDFKQSLSLTGVSFGGGPGVQYVLNRHFAIGAQGLFAAGSAKWERLPFFNSSGRRYNPGIAGAEGFLTYRRDL